MRWAAQIRVFYSKSRCISVILVSLFVFIVYTSFGRRRLLSPLGTDDGTPSGLSSRPDIRPDIHPVDKIDAFVEKYLEGFAITSKAKVFLASDSADSTESVSSPPPPPYPHGLSSNTALGAHRVDFDPHGRDVLVVLHTQKTGGTEFLRHLVTVKREGQFLCLLPSAVIHSITEAGTVPKNQQRRAKRRASSNPTSCPQNPSHPYGQQWLVAEKTVSWVCGLHASLNEYRRCLPTLNIPRFKFSSNLRFHYTILLRHPVLRYLSEYLHVQRGATWSSQHMCAGKPITPSDMPPCYEGFYARKPWPNLTLSSFVSCKSNWGNNRQTMMLADLESVHCYDKSAMSKEEREMKLLESAKSNLRSLAFFGVTEYMLETCHLFEVTFGMKFAVLPGQRTISELHSAPMLTDLWYGSDMYQAIMLANHLDVQLYDYALELFSQRAQGVGIAINKNVVEQAVKQLQADPRQLRRMHRRANYKIS